MTSSAERTARSPYHHGRLAESLVEAGLELARAEGPGGVGLRAASRRAGVSHNAAYRHFSDLDALLAAVGSRCMRQLALLMEARTAAVAEGSDDVAAAWSRLYAIGEAYVEFAVTETGWFRTAFTAHHQPPSAETVPEGAGDSGLGPYQLLSARLDELVKVGAVPAERRPGLEFAAWSAVHGYATLLVDGPLRALPEPQRASALRVVLDVVARGL